MGIIFRITQFIAFFLLLAFFGAQEQLRAEEPAYSLTLVRHAEKTSGGFDPELSGFGQARARFFARWLSSPNIQAVWSSKFRRTLDSAIPLATKLRQEVRIYDPRQQQLLVRQLHEEKLNAFVVGHSNTIPQLAAMLCECTVEPMKDTEYERAFRLLVAEGKTSLSEIDLLELWKDR